MEVLRRKEETEGGYSLDFEPVTSGSAENEEFFKWTPWGELKMGTVNHAVGKAMEVGKEYYLDISPAD